MKQFEGIKKARESEKAEQAQSVFEGFTFYFLGSEFSSGKSRADLTKLIKDYGKKYIPRLR